MPARRLTERQKGRIGLLQEQQRQRLQERAEPTLTSQDDEQPREGRVVVRHGAHLAVEDTDGSLRHCLARQNLGEPVCGDRVVWQRTGPENGVVTAILPRQTTLSRPDFTGRDKPLAANITQLVTIFAPVPPPTGYLLDQYLAAAENLHVKAAIALNKVDLLDAATHAHWSEQFGPYQDIGYPLLWISARDDQGLAPLIHHLQGETSILVGQSGVGKSSLVKALIPDQEIPTGLLSEARGVGRHTTSTARCYHLPQGGLLIDSPGVRSFRLGTISRSLLEQGFREFGGYLGHCRFSDCRHDQEPQCAIKQAVENGLIRPERLHSFHQLASELTR
jgi:ribosome biogenesis GTPase / thiamine phosphate phosphatase